MTQRSSQFILLAVTALSLSAYSLAFGRGGGGGHVGGGAHEHARPEQRAPETATQANHENPVEANRAENTNNNREQEVLRHDIVNPYVNRAEANRYDAAYWNREGYWGWGGFGGDGWTTNSPPPNAQPSTP